MKLLITGTGGFVGSRLFSYYKNKYDIWAPSHQEYDFTNKDTAWKGMQGFVPDVVLHCAAISDVGTCEKNPELSMRVNVMGTGNLAECCAQMGAKFVSCSSDQVYVRPPHPGEEIHKYLTPWKETDAEEPTPLYGKHKLLAERNCQEILPESVFLRLTWMYGTLSEKEAAAGRRNMEVILREALLQKQQAAFSATDYRAVTDIGEVVRNMEKAWELPGGVYNFGSTADSPIYDTVCRAFEIAGIPVWDSDADMAQRIPRDLPGVRMMKQESGSLRNLTMDTGKLEAAGIRFADTVTGLAHCIQKIMEDNK